MQRRGGALGAVLFTDIVGSTAIAAEMGNTRWSELVARHHRIVRRELGRFDGHEVDTAGDGFFATFERPADAIRCAVAVTQAVRTLGIEIRAGVSFGELESVGRKASGLVVNTAARVMSVAGPGEVLVPASVREITSGGGISFADHGVHQLKGLEGEFRLFKVIGVDGTEVAAPLETPEAAERRRDIFPTGSSRRRALVIGIGAGVLAVIVAAALVLTGSERSAPPASAGRLQDSVASFDVEQGRLGTKIPLTDSARLDDILEFIDQPIAVGEGGVWVLQPPVLRHVDPLHQEALPESYNVAFARSHMVATGFDAVWVQSAGTISKVHPATDEGEIFFELPVRSGLVQYSSALGDDAIWVAESDGTLVRVDPATGTPAQAETGLVIDIVATTRHAVWATDRLASEVSEIDPETLRAVGPPIQFGGNANRVVGRGEFLWILDRDVGAVTRVNATTRNVGPPARVGDDATGLAVGEEVVWVADLGGSLYRIDIDTLEVDQFPIGFEVLGVAVDPAHDDSVWLYLGSEID